MVDGFARQARVMRDVPVWVAAASGAACAATLAWLIMRLGRALESWKIRRRFSRGRSGQKRARGYLESRGFAVLGEEVPLPGVVEVDGQQREYELRLDFVVRRGRRTFGVEVKTGKRAPDPMHRGTRRQLLEYSAHLGLCGVLLLDMEAGRLMEVRFPALDRGRRSGWIWALLLGAAAGAALARVFGGGG